MPGVKKNYNQLTHTYVVPVGQLSSVKLSESRKLSSNLLV